MPELKVTDNHKALSKFIQSEYDGAKVSPKTVATVQHAARAFAQSEAKQAELAARRERIAAEKRAKAERLRERYEKALRDAGLDEVPGPVTISDEPEDPEDPEDPERVTIGDEPEDFSDDEEDFDEPEPAPVKKTRKPAAKNPASKPVSEQTPADEVPLDPNIVVTESEDGWAEADDDDVPWDEDDEDAEDF